MKGFFLLALLLCTTGSAAAQESVGSHASRQRLSAAAKPSEDQSAAVSPSAKAVEPASPLPPSACQSRLARIAEFTRLGPVTGRGECGVADAVLLQSVTLPDHGRVAVVPPATLRCTMAEAVASWLREEVAPAALKLGALRALDDFDSYECRGRNRVAGAKLSEHARGNALDVRGFRLADGRFVGLTDVTVAKDWRAGLRTSACSRFSTVLGPGSDGYHENHIHLDLAERRRGYKLCHWELREPANADKTPVGLAKGLAEGGVPLPRPRPEAADQVARFGPDKLRGRTR